jgi:hypothetical protein
VSIDLTGAAGLEGDGVARPQGIDGDLLGYVDGYAVNPVDEVDKSIKMAAHRVVSQSLTNPTENPRAIHPIIQRVRIIEHAKDA